MTTARAHGDAGRRTPPPALALAAALLLLMPRSAPADASARADLSYADQSSSEAGSSLYLRQQYQAAFDQAFSGALRYELRLEFTDDTGSSASLASARTPLHTWLLRPTGALAWTGDDMAASLTFNRAYRETLDPLTDRMQPRWMDSAALTTQFEPLKDLRAHLGVGYDAVVDVPASIRSSTDTASLQLDWTRGPLRLTQDSRVSATEDTSRGTKRLVWGPRFEADYAQAFGQRASVSTRYHVDYQRALDTTLDATASTALVQVQAVAGTYAVNDLPTDTPTPMTRLPALVDGNYGASTGISLGPDGFSFQNLGIDAGRSLPADQAWVHVRDRGGNPVPTGGPVTWSVYASEDGVRWVAAAAPPSTTFDPARSLYRIDFPATTARYFKVVSFGTNTLDTYVTELEVFHQESLAGDRTRQASTLAQGIEAGLTFTPFRLLLLGFQGAFSATANAMDGVSTLWALEGTQAYSARVGPFANVTFDGAHTRMNVGAVQGRPASSSQSTSAGARWQPLPTYDASVVALLTDDENYAARGHTVSVTHDQHLVPYSWLRLTAGASVTWQQLAGTITDDRSDARFLGATATAEVHVLRELEVRGDASVQHQETRSQVGTTDTLPISHVIPAKRFGIEGDWRPSTQLYLSSRVGWLSLDARSGVTQRYRLDWRPFPGGAMQLSGSFDTEVDPLTGQSFRRVTATPRWLVNAFTQLGVSYSYVRRSTAAGPQWDQSLFATFSLVL